MAAPQTEIIIVWDHRRICGPSLTETSLCGVYLYILLSVVRLGAGKRPYRPTFYKVEFNVLVLASLFFFNIYYIDQSSISLNSNKTDIFRKVCLLFRKNKEGVVKHVIYFE